MALQCQIRWHDGAIYLFNWEIYPIFGQFWGRAVRRTSQDSNLGLGRFRFLPQTTKIAGQCTSGCANPKGCISLAKTANLPQLRTQVRTN